MQTSVTTVAPHSIKLMYWDKESSSTRENEALNTSRFRPLKHLCLAPYKVAMAFWTLANLKLYPECILTEQTPTLQKWCEKGAYFCGLNPTYHGV